MLIWRTNNGSCPHLFLLATISFLIKFKIKHGRTPTIEETEYVFLANLAFGFPLAWIETGGVGGIGKSLAENAKRSLDDLYEKGLMELAEASHPDSITRSLVIYFLSHELPESLGTVLFSIQDKLAKALVSVMASFKFDGEPETAD